MSTKLLRSRFLQYVGSAVLFTVSVTYIVEGLSEHRFRFPFVTDGLALRDHPFYYCVMMAFWLVVLSLSFSFGQRPVFHHRSQAE